VASEESPSNTWNSTYLLFYKKLFLSNYRSLITNASVVIRPQILLVLSKMVIKGSAKEKRGKLFIYNILAPPLYKVERGLGGEYMRLKKTARL